MSMMYPKCKHAKSVNRVLQDLTHADEFNEFLSLYGSFKDFFHEKLQMWLYILILLT